MKMAIGYDTNRFGETTISVREIANRNAPRLTCPSVLDLRRAAISAPTSEPTLVPSRKPKIVERKVKAMSVQASPSVTKMVKVFQIADGCDQKNALSSPVVAAISHAAMIAIRTPIWVVTMAQVGQSF